MLSRNRFGCRRRVEIRPVLPVVVVVCDDTKTAVRYFEQLKHEVKERRTVYVYPAPHSGAGADDVISFAESKRPQTAEPDDHLFALVDLDSNPDADLLREKGISKNIRVVRSQPCYEVWTLAHFEDTGEAFLNCKAVLSRIELGWKTTFGQQLGPKAQADYSKLKELRDQAIARCRLRGPGTNQSWTEVWQAAVAIIA